MTLPIGYTQSNASLPLSKNPLPLSLSIIGDPIPAAHYQRVNNIKKSIFPRQYLKVNK